MDDIVTLRIPAEMKQALEEICKTEGINMSVVVRSALKRLIALHQFEALRDQIAPFAEKAGIFSDEDILNLPS
jgi:Arc/MetJ-type ribon-helix-helix transcriptional regulator